jgi:hypothetical protein
MSLLKKFTNSNTGIAKLTLVLSILIALLIPVTLLATRQRWELRRSAAPAPASDDAPELKMGLWEWHSGFFVDEKLNQAYQDADQVWENFRSIVSCGDCATRPSDALTNFNWNGTERKLDSLNQRIESDGLEVLLSMESTPRWAAEQVIAKRGEGFYNRYKNVPWDPEDYDVLEALGTSLAQNQNIA